MSGKTPEAAKDAKTVLLEGQLDKLKKKRVIYQAHLKAVAQVSSSEDACNTLVQFITKHQAGDHLFNNHQNNYAQVGPKGCCG